jgi:CubicO group peptidase (beta-lactamase class C family)
MLRKKRHLLAVLVAVHLSWSAATHARPQEEKPGPAGLQETVDGIVGEFVRADGPGLAIAVIHQGEVVLRKTCRKGAA